MSMNFLGFNPLHRGMGVLTSGVLTAGGSSAGFNPLHRGMGVLTRPGPVSDNS